MRVVAKLTAIVLLVAGVIAAAPAVPMTGADELLADVIPGSCIPEGYEPSPAVHDVVAETDQYVTTEDGTDVQVDVYRPDATGPHPVIVWFDVYYKDDPTGPVVNSERDFFVERGYAFVHASSPGSNNSGGEYDVFGPEEQAAVAAVVEWSGEQPWSTGEVAMDGLSYAAIIQLFAGARGPSSLTTLYPAATFSDMYREIAYIGGMLQTGYPIYWDVGNRSYNHLPPFSWGDQPARTATNWATSAAGFRPLLVDFAQHPFDDEYWHVRSPRYSNAKVTVPFALDVGWHDDMVAGGPRNFETVGAGRSRLVIGPWGHSESHRRPGGRAERLRWYDHHLKGLDSGIDCDPRVRVFIPEGGDDDAGRWVAAEKWPLPRTQTEELHLSANGALRADEPTASGSVAYDYMPNRQDTPSRIVFETEPLQEPMEVVGYGELVLQASTTAPDTHFTATVYDVGPDGEATRLARGWLRARMRETDPAQSRPGRPHHLFERELEVPPGEPVEYRVGLLPFANRFPAGHSIRVEISDASSGPSGTPMVTPPYPGSNTIHFGPQLDSRLVLPVWQPEPEDLE